MTNVIVFPKLSRKENYSYSINGGDITINSDCGRLVIDPNVYSISISGEVFTFASRQEMAQLLHAAAVMIDSEEIWKADEYPALNY